MKNISSHRGKLEIISRVKSSANGNPRFKVRIDGYTCYTTPDSSLAYKITNYQYKIVKAHIGSHYGVQSVDSVRLI